MEKRRKIDQEWLTPFHRCQVTYFLPTYSRLQRLSAVDSDSSAKKPGILFKVYQRATTVLLIHSVSTFCLLERGRELSSSLKFANKNILKFKTNFCFYIISHHFFFINFQCQICLYFLKVWTLRNGTCSYPFCRLLWFYMLWTWNFHHQMCPSDPNNWIFRF